MNGWKEIPKPDYWESQDEEEEFGSHGASGANPSHKATDFYTITQQTIGYIHGPDPGPTPNPSLDKYLSTKMVDGAELMSLVAHVWNRPLDTLYVARHDLELAGSMRRTVDNTHRALTQVVMATCVA